MKPSRLTRVVPVLLLLLAAAAWAGPTEESKEHYDRATVLYKQENYEEALKEFQTAYDRRQKPVLLYNMAQCYRQLGEARKALEYYQRYSDLAPDLTEDQRAKVQGYMDQMRKLMELTAKEQLAKKWAQEDKEKEPEAQKPEVPALPASKPEPPKLPIVVLRPPERRRRSPLRVSKWVLAGAGLASLIAGGHAVGARWLPDLSQGRHRPL